ncbi:MAG: DUF6748 domain-containing protein [Kofleriaceae bacterium]
MKTTTILAALPLTFVFACSASNVEDELAGEFPEDDVIEGKADSAADGSYTFFEISQDFRKCSAPMCGGFFLDRLNRTTTTCHDGSTSAQCYTPELDLTESGLSEAARTTLVDAANRSAIDAGVHALVRGRFGKTNSTIDHKALGRFIVTEIWVSQSDSVASGVFARVVDNGIRCITTPCPSTTEKGLNTSRSANISDIDFSESGLDDVALGELGNDLAQPYGYIIAGDRYSLGHGNKGRTATAVYRKLVEAPATACFVGGCSGQVCSDQEGVITTCEWREEYACYATATCERQGDGACGWTPTAELDSCLGSY